MLNVRQVCTLWRRGIDELTRKGGINFRGQSFVSLKAAQYLIQRGKEVNHPTTNPFPSRTVRMSVMLNEGGPPEIGIAPETEVIRAYGCHIHFLIIKLITCSTKRRAMLNVLRNMTMMLSHLTNLHGLSIYISFVFDNARYYSTRGFLDYQISRNYSLDRNSLDKEFTFEQLSKLKAFRLVAWNFSSQETEWLYYKILRESPNLTMFDPDFYMGFSKFHTIFSHPTSWPFQLTCLKLALSGKECREVFILLKSAKFPLESIYLDIFEYSCEKGGCGKVISCLLKCCQPSLKTLAVSFYMNSEKGVPLTTVHQAAGEALSASSNFIRKVISYNSCHGNYSRDRRGSGVSFNFFKSFNLFGEMMMNGESGSKLEKLKLRGFKGSLNFLKDLKQLRRLILLDYCGEGQGMFNCEQAFYRGIPTLRELYTPRFGNLDARDIKAKMMDEKYLPIYW